MNGIGDGNPFNQSPVNRMGQGNTWNVSADFLRTGQAAVLYTTFTT